MPKYCILYFKHFEWDVIRGCGIKDDRSGNEKTKNKTWLLTVRWTYRSSGVQISNAKMKDQQQNKLQKYMKKNMIFFKLTDRTSKSLSRLQVHPTVFNHEENSEAYLHIQGQAKCMCTVTVGCQDRVSTEVDKHSQEDIWNKCDSTLDHRHKPGSKILTSFCAMASVTCVDFTALSSGYTVVYF